MSAGPEVLDASALLAWLQGEPGMDNVMLEAAVRSSTVLQRRY